MTPSRNRDKIEAHTDQTPMEMSPTRRLQLLILDPLVTASGTQDKTATKTEGLCVVEPGILSCLARRLKTLIATVSETSSNPALRSRLALVLNQSMKANTYSWWVNAALFGLTREKAWALAWG